jgi:hypothetical protein
MHYAEYVSLTPDYTSYASLVVSITHYTTSSKLENQNLHLKYTTPYQTKRNGSSMNAIHAQNRVITIHSKFCIYRCLDMGWRRPWSSLWPRKTSPWTQHGGSVKEQQEAKERS